MFEETGGCVAAGIGFAILPRTVVAEALAARRIRLHAPSAEIARTVTVFVQRRATLVTAALRCFLDYATGRMTQATREPMGDEIAPASRGPAGSALAP